MIASGGTSSELHARIRPPGSAAAIAAALGIALSGALPILMVGALGVQIRTELGVDAATLGLSVSVWAAAAALGAAVLGGLADRLGWQTSMMVAAALVVSSLAGVGLVARTWAVLAVAMALGGLGHSLALSSGNIAILAAVAPERRGLLLGLRQSAIPAAGLLAGLSVPLIAVRYGWRWSYGLALIVPLLVVVLVLRTRASHGRSDDTLMPFRLARPDLPFGVFAIVAMSGAFLVNSSATFTVSSLVDMGFTEAGAGTLFVVAWLAAVTGRIVVGLVADRRRSRGFAPITVMLLTGLVGFLYLASGMQSLAIIGLILAFAGGMGWSGLTHLVIITHHPDQPGGSSGLLLTAGFVGGAIGPVVYGAIADAAGYGAAWLACSVIALLAAGAAVASSRLYDRRDTVAPNPLS